jgi:hypothetical protein
MCRIRKRAFVRVDESRLMGGRREDRDATHAGAGAFEIRIGEVWLVTFCFPCLISVHTGLSAPGP